MNRPLSHLVVLCAAALFVLVFFWPGPYRHDQLRDTVLRVNRFTGRTEVLSPSSGWKDRHPGATPDAPLVVLAGGAALALAFFGGVLVGRRR